MSGWSEAYLGLIYQVYGLAFFVLGVAALLLPRDTPLRFARYLWLLAAFGMLHGALEFVEGARLEFSARWLDGLALFLLLSSFLALLEFGRRLLHDIPGTPRLPALWVYAVAALGVAVMTLAAADPLVGLAAGTRYFVGTPGALLTGLGLLATLRAQPLRLAADQLQVWLRVLGGAFLVYAVLTLFLSTGTGQWPGWLPSRSDFLALSGGLLPIELLRSLCALAATLALLGLVRQTGSNTSADLLRVLDTINGFIYRCHNDRDWSLVHLAGKVEKLCGYTPEDFIERRCITIGALIHPEDREQVWADVQEALDERRDFELSYRLLHRDGSLRWVFEYGRGVFLPDGRLNFLEGHITDITELHQAQLSLENFRNTLDHTLDSVFMFSTDSLQFFYVNRGAVEQTGYSRDELLQMHPYDIKPEFSETRFRELIAPLLRGERDTLRFETLHRHRNGHDVPVEIFLQSVAPPEQAPRFVAIVHDITQRKQAELRLQQSLAELKQSEQRQRELLLLAQREQSRMAALLSGMSIGILFEDRDGCVEYINPAFRRMWAIDDNIELVGRPTREVLNHSTHRFARPDHASRYVLHVLDTHEISERFEMDLYDGRILTQLSYPVADPDGRIIGRLWIYEDITHERQTAQQLVYLAEHDPLTGLFNRHRFQENLERMLATAKRNNSRFALLYFDLDEFKHINDSFGHRAGDTVLVRTAGEIASLVREGEVFARLGGDEFAVLTELNGTDKLTNLAERITHAIAAIPFRFRGSNLRLTASIGIATYPEHGDNAEDLVAHADAAMYQAKNLGKNTWAIYDASRNLSEAMVTRMTWINRINQALQDGSFELHFQGIYHTRDKRLSHLEALVRMQDSSHPEQLIMPGQFIPVAEKSGQILEIDRWVLRRSIETLATHPRLSALAVNVSGRSFDEPTLPKYIHELLQQHQVAPERLIIELTETAAVSEMQDAQRFIEALHQTGCIVCLDDFGTGFSTFAYLKYLGVQILKIDGMFIRDLPNNPDNQAFVKAMVDVARGLKKVTVAEFVEDGATLAMLYELGVDLAQGYHLDRPCAAHPALSQD